MRRKPLPPPPADLATLREAQAAVPLVPNSIEDCCDRLQSRLGLPSRETAAAWLDVLAGLGLAASGPAGYTRVRDEPNDATLARRFLEHSYGAREVLDAVAGETIDAGGVARRTESIVTPWERRRHGPDWRAIHRRRTADLLDWLVLFELAERTNDGYRTVD